MNVPEPIRAWWFSCIRHRVSPFEDRKAALGITHTNKWNPHAYASNMRGPGLLFGSPDILDAVTYAGPVVWRVELFGQRKEWIEFITAEHRRYIAGGVDVSSTLFAFARSCALDVIDLWDAPAAIRTWLESDGNDSLRLEALEALNDYCDGSIELLTENDAVLAARSSMDKDPLNAVSGVSHHAIEARCGRGDSMFWRSTDSWRIQNTRLTEMVSEAIGLEAES